MPATEGAFESIDRGEPFGTVHREINSCSPWCEQSQEPVVTGPAEGRSLSMTNQRPQALTEQRLTRRGAMRAGGIGAAAVLGGTTMKSAAAQDATPTNAHEAGGLRPLLSDNPMWEAFGNRALVLAID